MLHFLNSINKVEPRYSFIFLSFLCVLLALFFLIRKKLCFAFFFLSYSEIRDQFYMLLNFSGLF